MRLLKAILLGQMCKDAMADQLDRIQPLFTVGQIRMMSSENILPSSYSATVTDSSNEPEVE